MRNDYPKGVIGIYDAGAKHLDRYTVVYEPEGNGGYLDTWFPYVAMSENPTYPLGYCQHGSSRNRPTSLGCGKVIGFGELPETCQAIVLEELANDG